ncbi:extracellular serine protease [Fusarium austroafricanum]|uniref:Extracellular serine protease n=1 Tax=Fusarium austroafricanum TaxID=2364996 RepID=A0A8H4KH05_9HYPO|nr:extracellular serine protease [Fusarium austroafricanum]
MLNDEPEGSPLTTARKLIPLISKSIANVNETKSLALMNSRSELDFQLSLALLELGNDQCPPQNDERERLPRHARSLLDVLGTLVRENKDQHLKPGDAYQRLKNTLARSPGYETDSEQLSLIQLPQTAQELRGIAKKVSSLRKHLSGVESDLGSGHDYTSKSREITTREESHEANNLHSVRGRPDQQRQPSPESSREEKAAKDFMKQAEDFYEKKIVPLDKNEAIKVAVLDTGVDENERIFKAARGQSGKSLKEVKSFIERDSQDTYGHGTEVAGLIAKMAPHIDLFIAKISKVKTVLGVDQYVQAIEWAMRQKVHIINISSSVTEDEDIKNAISAAEAQGIIVFAAASDDEANKPRAFPAKMDKVLAIHFTDGWGNICKENPQPAKYDVNFSTLGENILSPLCKGGLLRGTSYATAIASGMAANILTLAAACFGESGDDGALRRQVFKREGMKKIFLKVSGERNGYNYVCPLWVAKGRDSLNGYRDWLKDALG